MEVLFAGGFWSNIPAVANTLKKPPKATINVIIINKGEKNGLALNE